jgi:acyl-CoA synthetase (AMP-forming)/AMP-acid ligase II
LDLWDELGRSVAPYERGEIVLRGPKVFKGYWRDPDATAAAFAGGWFHTGDIGVRDDEGYLWIVDRLKDMIKVSGFQVAPVEVERAIRDHPAVDDAGVVGHPDDRVGEIPIAYVVADPELTAAQLDFWLHGRLASYKCPRRYRFVAELPRTAAGKLRRAELRAWQADGGTQFSTSTNAASD